MRHERKPGQCGQTAEFQWNASRCYNDCDDSDYRCSGTRKCCVRACSHKCLDAAKLDDIPLSSLPSVPADVNTTSLEFRVRREAQISWKMPWESADSVEFIVESRLHVGHTFSEHKLGEWFAVRVHAIQRLFVGHQHQHVVCSIPLRIGRWYMFRVASINANGTRGYSQSSVPFKLDEGKSFWRKVKCFIH